MRIAYLDCFSGISGDMFLGAVLDARPDLAALLEKTVAGLDIGARIEIARTSRSGISSTKVDVLIGGEKDRPRDTAHSHEHEHQHGHSHTHSHEPTHEHHHGRSLKEIRRIIADAPISDNARRTALAIFEALGAAEARIHNTDIEKIHFHEVGAADALVDIVGAAVLADALAVDAWVCSPVNVGGGTVQCAHGTFPVPAPATVELLRGAPVYSSGVEAELATPTGAAIAKTLATRFSSFPRMTVEAASYGAGTRDFPGHANVLRLTLGEAPEESEPVAPADTVSVLEANLDDLNPQVFGYVMERALAEGALEVFATPVQMKKNRPGMLLTLLCRPEDTERLARLLFAETTTLGVRMRREERRTLARRSVTVETRWGAVQVKVANLNGTVSNCAPEYEDCRRLAAQHGVPLKVVMQEAIRVYLERENG